MENTNNNNRLSVKKRDFLPPPLGDVGSGPNSIDILDVLDRLGIEYKKNGNHYWARCIWHDDKHPSMLVGGKRNIVHCFSCGKSANVIGLVMHVKGMRFKEACEWLGATPFPPCGHPFPVKGQGDSNERGGQDTRKQWYREKLERIVAPRVRRIEADKNPFDVLNISWYNHFVDITMKSSFVRCMTHVFGIETTMNIVENYRLGVYYASNRYDDVMFPSIDINGRLRDVKIQAYDCDDRSKQFFHSSMKGYWLGPVMHKERIFNRNCLFGEHLLSRRPNDTVMLVESPKNACVGAAEYPQYVWVATGNKNMLKREVLEVLRDRRVVVFPDADAVGEWNEKLEGMKDIALFMVMQSPGIDGKSDIADWIINAHLTDQ